jgi:hypothetical protein
MPSLSRFTPNGWQPGAQTATVDDFVPLFWERADKSGECWEWLGRKNWRGYGQITSKWFKTVQAHRIAYELTFGPIPAGLLCCHTCDNRGCVNPAHLFVGTDRDNVQDMLRKGRSSRVGSKNPHAKLTEAQIPLIRQAWMDGALMTDLGREFGVSDSAIQEIVAGHTWRHVEEAA